MFQEKLIDLPISGGLWDKVFPEILIDRSTIYNKSTIDDTFETTLRILLQNRIPDGQEVHFKGYRAITEGSLPTRFDSSALSIFGSSSTMSVPSLPIDFTEMKDLARYCANIAVVRVFVNPKIKSTVVFVGSRDDKTIIRAWHFIQSFIPRLLPWFFGERTPTEEEIKLLHTLQEKTPKHYVEAVDAYVRSSNFDQKLLTCMLEGFGTSQIDNRIKRVTEEIRQTQIEMSNALTNYRQCYEAQQSLNIKLLGLEEAKRTAPGDADLLDFFQKNPYIRLNAAGRGALHVTISTTLRFFDQDSYELMSRRPQSILFEHIQGATNAFNDPQRRKLFLDAIFKHELFKVRLQAKYAVGPSIVEARSHFDVSPDYLPNPHIYNFACLGNYAAPMAEALRDGDYISALMQCVSSAGSVNINEVVTMEKFLQDLFSPQAGNVIEFPNGMTVTPLRALEWLENIQKEGSANE